MSIENVPQDVQQRKRTEKKYLVKMIGSTVQVIAVIPTYAMMIGNFAAGD